MLVLIVILLFSAGCQNKTGQNSSEITPPSSSTESNSNTPADSKILVLYFSCTGTTEQIAQWIAEKTNADVYQIIPETPYTPEDLNYDDPSSRATMEQNNPSARPSILGSIDNLEMYDTVFLGYPIWWGQSPKIISTLLENYDFSGKTIVPFCTSHSSGIGSSDTNLHSLCSDSVNWIPGERFSSESSMENVKEWIDSLDIQIYDTQNIGVFNFKP